ncbi:MAG: HDIG domain-containing protein [Acidobacteria bacterium]|nr:HDIG domain-containing protein [Acidobacteriota bacterium]
MSDPPKRRGQRSLLTALLDAEHLWSVVALAAIVGISSTQLGVRSYDFVEGDIADADVIAPVELRVSDPVATTARRDEARQRVVDVYDFDPFAWQAPVASLNALYAWGRAELGNEEEPAGWADRDQEAQTRLSEAAEATFGLQLPADFMSQAWAEGFTAVTELEAERLLRSQLQHSLIGTLNPLDLGVSPAIRIRDITDQQERVLEDPESVGDLRAARDWLRRESQTAFELDPLMERALGELLALLARSNLNFNANETQMRRQAAEAAIDQAFYTVQRGRTIVREGDPVTPQIERELAALRSQWSGGTGQTSQAGLTVVIGLAIFGMWRFARYRLKCPRPRRVVRLYQLMLLMLVTSVLMIRIMMFIGDAVAGSFLATPYNVPESYRLAIPYAMGALVLVLLADAEVAWIYAALQTVAVGALTGDVELALFSLLGSFAAVLAMTRFAERTEMLRAVAVLGVVNGLTILGLSLMQQPVPPWSLTGFQVGLAFFGAVQAALLASALLPPLEYMFDTLTDIKLLELSNMNLPLLKRLAVVAPGTYHHSVVIGTLTEKAAEAIGANALFCRVAAYYHDVGKMKQPEYFIENQKEGARNPHEGLAPSASADVLIRHVTEGIAYAEEHKLPRPLLDAIPQHHGTSLIRYFYSQAAEAAGDEGVDEFDYRYPGPKPQTREAALIMLADGVEARSRLIDDPNARSLQAMIHDQVRNVLDDGQLDECDITLGDLAKVEEAFLDVLSGMHHSRIEYPDSINSASDNPVITS